MTEYQEPYRDDYKHVVQSESIIGFLQPIKLDVERFLSLAKFHADPVVLHFGQGWYAKAPEKTENCIDLTSDSVKLIVPATNSFWQMIHNLLGEIFMYYERMPNIEIIYTVEDINQHINSPYTYTTEVHNFIFRLLDFYKIKYTVVEKKQHATLLVNNYYQFWNQPNTSYTELVYKYISIYMRSKFDMNVKPFRKVYLSRKHLDGRKYEINHFYYMAQPRVDHDNRIDSHDVIERLFENLGFEVINPEVFPSFEEQLKFFNEVKCIASLTSSGLTNAIFMQPNQSVVELVTPLSHWFADHVEEQIHFYYGLVSLVKNHKYFGFQNLWRTSKGICDTIVNDKQLVEYLRSI